MYYNLRHTVVRVSKGEERTFAHKLEDKASQPCNTFIPISKEFVMAEKCKRPNQTRGEPHDLSKIEEFILLSLLNKELYGLQVSEGVQQVSGGRRTLKMGSLYPTLRKLEKNGLVTARWGDERPEERSGARRRYYKLTGNGEAALDALASFRNNLAEWQPG